MFKLYAVLAILAVFGGAIYYASRPTITADDLVSDASVRYRQVAGTVAHVCEAGKEACNLAIAGAVATNPEYTFKNPYSGKAQPAKALELMPAAQAIASVEPPEGKVPPVRQKVRVARHVGPLVGRSRRHGDVSTPVKFEAKYIAQRVAKEQGVPQAVLFCLVKQESGWNPNATSPAGAFGLAQLMPATAKALHVDINDPYGNLTGGAKYLKQQKTRFGSWELALAAYNAGPNAVSRYKGIPPYRETQGYVRTIAKTAMSHYGFEV